MDSTKRDSEQTRYIQKICSFVNYFQALYSTYSKSVKNFQMKHAGPYVLTNSERESVYV